MFIQLPYYDTDISKVSTANISLMRIHHRDTADQPDRPFYLHSYSCSAHKEILLTHFDVCSVIAWQTDTHVYQMRICSRTLADYCFECFSSDKPILASTLQTLAPELFI